MNESSLLAEDFIPKEYLAENGQRATLILPAVPPPVLNWTSVTCVPGPPPVCRCQSNIPHQFPLSKPTGEEVEQECRYGILARLSPQLHPYNKQEASNVRIPDIELKCTEENLTQYTNAFRQLLKVEWLEKLTLYERYSQYHKEASIVSNKLNSQLTLKIHIPGISDARPTPQTGDILLVRPTNPLALPYHWQHAQNWPGRSASQTVEIVSHITRISRRTDPTGDAIQATWLEPQLASVVEEAYDGQTYHNQTKKVFNIRIIPSSKLYRNCLTALDWVQSIKAEYILPILFPTHAPILKAAPSTEIPEELNGDQASFIRIVLSRTLQPSFEMTRPPAILTGPAGTGKTKTLLHAISQVLRVSDTNRILVCAPSHTAANVIAQRLIGLIGSASLLRLLDPDRPVETIPVSILACCFQDSETGAFCLPPGNKLLDYRVVVATCNDSSILYRSGLTNEQLRIRRQCFATYCRTECQDRNVSVSFDGVDEPHFTHLFVDEAAQASEPESLIPLTVVLDPASEHTRKVEIILCGDPRQLAPSIYSNETALAGLEQSWMERLLLRPVACLGGGQYHMLGPLQENMDDWLRYSLKSDGQEQLTTFLTLNYRGHVSFLMLPSALFYSDRLQRAGYDADTDLDGIKGCQLLRTLETLAPPVRVPSDECDPICKPLSQQKEFNWPIHFRAVLGKDMSTSIKASFASGSWSNPEEAKTIVELLLTLTSQGVSPVDIGVMAPFRGQVVLVRRLLRENKLGGVDVGTIEDYQAVERKVIVLSLTRSSPTFVEEDKKRRVGVFGQPKRSNVALTRAECLLIVVCSDFIVNESPFSFRLNSSFSYRKVGSPRVMFEDFVWRQFLSFCLRNGFWYGDKCHAESTIRWTKDRSKSCLENAKDSLSFRVGNDIEGQEEIVISALEQFYRKKY